MNKSKKTYFGSVMGQRCPKCRTGNLFTHSPYTVSKFMNMNSNCSHCGQKFELENSFFYGAMYVSYAFQVALFSTVWVAFNVLYPEASFELKFGFVIGIVILLLPIILRLSRSLWIHFFVKFKPSKNPTPP